MKKIYLQLLLAILVFLGGSYLYFSRPNSANQAAQADAMRADNLPAAEDTAPNQPEKLADPANLRGAFERSDDLFTLARMHSNSNDPESSWLVAKIVDYCSPFGMNPKGYISQYELMLSLVESEVKRSALKAAHDRVISRCGGFDNPQRTSTFVANADLVLKRKAARAGSLAAEAALLSRKAPMQADLEYVDGLLGRVRASRDPDAFLAVSTAMGLDASGKEEIFGRVSGSTSSMYAWQLAACSIGLNCNSNGALMTQYCSAGGICEAAPNLESLIFNHLVTRPEEVEIRRMTNEIVSNIINSK